MGITMSPGVMWLVYLMKSVVGSVTAQFTYDPSHQAHDYQVRYIYLISFFLVAVTFCWCHCHIQDLPYLRFVCSLSLIMSLNVRNTYTAMSCLCNFLPIIFANKMC